MTGRSAVGCDFNRPASPTKAAKLSVSSEWQGKTIPVAPESIEFQNENQT
jgi:hypothetical protein